MQTLTGQTFFPNLISDPFKHGLLIAFLASIAMLLIAVVASLLRGGRFVHDDAMHADEAVSGHETVTEAWAREGAALDGVPDQDAAYEQALAGRGAPTGGSRTR